MAAVLVGMGIVTIAHGETQVVPLIVPSQLYRTNVFDQDDIPSWFQEAYASTLPSQPSPDLPREVATSPDGYLPAGGRTRLDLDWIPRFKEQGGPPASGGGPGPGVVKEEPVEPIRQLVPVWHMVPTLSVSERYDSNVFFTAKQFVPANASPDDFVTTVNPQLAILHAGRLVQGRLVGGATSEFFVENPDLNYTGFNGQLYLDFAQAAKRLLPRTRSLILSDSILYTPQLPAFFQGGPNFSGIDVAPSQNADAFGRGIQAFRINTLMNTGSAQASYELSPTTAFGLGYTRSDAQFSKTYLGPGSASSVFNTNSQTISAGLSIRTSGRDFLSPGYLYNEVFSSGFGTFKSHTLSVSWSRTISPSLSSSVTGGAGVFEGFTSQSTGDQLIKPGALFPNAGVLLRWFGGGVPTGQQLGGPSMQAILPAMTSPSLAGFGDVPLTGGTFLPHGSSAVALNFSVGMFPSFFIEAGPMIGINAWIQGAHGLTDRLGLTGGVNYARSDTAVEGGSLSFVSLSTNMAFNYLMTPKLRASLIYTYGNYQQNAGGTDNGFDRQTVMLNLTYVFGESFPRLGALAPRTPSDSGGLDKR
ncbi:MAG: hypothetical protein ACREIH_09860 [Nitrospiraceae bacterium]